MAKAEERERRERLMIIFFIASMFYTNFMWLTGRSFR
jgi:hypothetical protein